MRYLKIATRRLMGIIEGHSHLPITSPHLAYSVFCKPGDQEVAIEGHRRMTGKPGVGLSGDCGNNSAAHSPRHASAVLARLIARLIACMAWPSAPMSSQRMAAPISVATDCRLRPTGDPASLAAAPSVSEPLPKSAVLHRVFLLPTSAAHLPIAGPRTVRLPLAPAVVKRSLGGGGRRGAVAVATRFFLRLGMRQRVLLGLALLAQCLGFCAHQLQPLVQHVRLGTSVLDIVRLLLDLVL